MIHLDCANCLQRLEMDAAFAGGVCRCCHCGTIQTVPANSSQGTTPAAAARPLYRREEAYSEPPDGSPEWTGLRRGSGSFSAMPSSGLHRQAQTVRPAPPATDPRLTLAVGGAATMTFVAATVAIMLLGSSDMMNPAPASALERVSHAPAEREPVRLREVRMDDESNEPVAATQRAAVRTAGR